MEILPKVMASDVTLAIAWGSYSKSYRKSLFIHSFVCLFKGNLPFLRNWLVLPFCMRDEGGWRPVCASSEELTHKEIQPAHVFYIVPQVLHDSKMNLEERANGIHEISV